MELSPLLPASPAENAACCFSVGRNQPPCFHPLPLALLSGQTLLFCGNLSSAAKPNENLALGEKGEFLEFLALVEIFKW